MSKDIEFQVGNVVQHRGSLRYGTVREIREKHNGNEELLVAVAHPAIERVWWSAARCVPLDPFCVRCGIHVTVDPAETGAECPLCKHDTVTFPTRRL